MLIAESEGSNPIILSKLTSGSPCLCLFKLLIVLDFAQCALQFYTMLFADRNPNYSPQEASPLTLGWHTAPLTGGGRLTIPFAPPQVKYNCLQLPLVLLTLALLHPVWHTDPTIGGRLITSGLSHIFHTF